MAGKKSSKISRHVRIRRRLKQKRAIKQTDTQIKTRAILDSTTLLELQDWANSILTPEPIRQDSENHVVIDQITENNEVADDKSALFQLAYEQIQKRLDEFLFFEVFIYDAERIEELHQMRISAKQLRYSLEVFSDLYKNKSDFALEIARQSQQYLGEIHDADVWTLYIPRLAEKERERIHKFYGYKSPFNRLKPGIEYLLKNRQNERNRLYKQFLDDWKKWKMKETWLNLRKVIFLTSLEEQHSNIDSTST